MKKIRYEVISNHVTRLGPVHLVDLPQKTILQRSYRKFRLSLARLERWIAVG